MLSKGSYEPSINCNKCSVEWSFSTVRCHFHNKTIILS